MNNDLPIDETQQTQQTQTQDKQKTQTKQTQKKRGRPKQIVKTEIKIIPGPVWLHLK